MTQTAVLATPADSVAGLILRNHEILEIESRVVQTAAIGVGLAVTKGTADYQVIAPGSAAGITGTGFEGVGVYDPTSEPGTRAVGKGLAVLRKGTIAVQAEAGDYTKNQAANIRYAGTGSKGALVQTAVTDETAVCPYLEIIETKTLAAAGLIACRVIR